MNNFEKLVRFFIDLDCGNYELSVEDYQENIRVVKVYQDDNLLEELRLAVTYDQPNLTAEEFINSIRTTEDDVIDELPDYGSDEYSLEPCDAFDAFDHIEDTGGDYSEK